ncbi:MAG TPA: hypothetical protein PK231_05715, partial [Acidocella sp.]|nr:hypothetical protein [Acidocella sp.]
MNKVFFIVPAVACAAAVAGCSMQIAQYVTDANLVVQGLTSAEAVLPTVKGLTAAQVTQIDADIVLAQNASAGIAAAANAVGAQPSVKSLEAALNDIVAVAAGILPPPASVILQAAQVLLPVIEQAVGLAVPSSAVQAGSMPMTPAV